MQHLEFATESRMEIDGFACRIRELPFDRRDEIIVVVHKVIHKQEGRWRLDR